MTTLLWIVLYLAVYMVPATFVGAVVAFRERRNSGVVGVTLMAAFFWPIALFGYGVYRACLGFYSLCLRVAREMAAMTYREHITATRERMIGEDIARYTPDGATGTEVALRYNYVPCEKCWGSPDGCTHCNYNGVIRRRIPT